MHDRTWHGRRPRVPLIISGSSHDRRRMIGVGRWFGVVIAGFALGWAFPPHGPWWLGPLAVAVFTLCLREQRTPVAAALGFVFGMVFFTTLQTWMIVVGIDAWLLLSAVCALWFAPVGIATAWVMRLRGWPIWVACIWVAEEALRDRVPLGGYPWGRLAFVTGDSGLSGYAWLLGAPGVTFAMALVGALVAYAAVGIHSARGVGKLRMSTFAVSIAAICIVVIFAAMGHLRSFDRDSTNAEAHPSPAAVPIAIVQGNVPQAGLDFQGQREQVLRNHVQATLDLAASVKAGKTPAPAFVIWPENATDIDPYQNSQAAALIQSAVDAVRVPVLVGAVATNPRDPGTIVNLGIVWHPTTATSVGGPGQTYAKRHPVPFGEYIPGRSLIGSLTERFTRIPRDFAPGESPGVLEIGGVTIGDVICFEVAYDQEPRDVTNGGAQLLVVQTNNATYGNTGQPEQQLAIEQLRAIEHDRTMLVAATSGISAVIDHEGRLQDRSTEFTQIVLSTNAVLANSRSPSDRLGEWPEWLLTVMAVLVVLLARRQLRPRRQHRVVSHPTKAEREVERTP